MTLLFGSLPAFATRYRVGAQLVDRDSHDLRQSADAIIDRATTGRQLYPGIHRDAPSTRSEVVSKPRSTVAERAADLTDCIDYPDHLGPAH